MNLLVLNCFSRNALAVIKHVGQEFAVYGADMTASVISGEPSFIDNWFKHRNLKKVFRYCDPKIDPNKFKADLIDVCNSNNIDIVIPTGTYITNLLSYFKHELSQNMRAKLAVDDWSKMQQLTDKWHISSLCRKLDINIPETILIDSQVTFGDLIHKLGLPFIVKPRLSYASKGVQFIDTEQQYNDFIKSGVLSKTNSFLLDANQPEYIAQKILSGELHDITSCSNNGQPITLLSQKRAVTLFDFGGGGIVNITTDDRELKNIAQKLISHISWKGILQIDFLKDKNGKNYLIECNPKFWGTTELTILAGCNVARQLVDIFSDENMAKYNQDSNAITINDYEKDLLFKWYYPEIIFYWLHKPFNLTNLIKRIKKTYSEYGQKRSLNNIKLQNLKHLLGITLNKYNSRRT